MMLNAWLSLEFFSMFCQEHVLWMVGESRHVLKQTDINLANKIDICCYFISVLITFEDMLCIFIVMKARSFDKADRARKMVANRDQKERTFKLMIETSCTTATGPPKYEDIAEIV